MTQLPPTNSSLLARARDLAAAHAWREVRAMLAPAEAELGEDGEGAVLYAEALIYTGGHREALRWLRAAEPRLRATSAGSLYRRAINMIGAAHLAIGELEDAAAAFSMALELATQAEDSLVLARATNNLGAIANLRGDHDGALSHYRIALPAFQRLGQRRGLSATYHNIAITLRDTGALDDADENERWAIEHASAGGIPRLAAMGRIGRAELALRRGDAAFAEIAGRLAAEEFVRLEDPQNEGDARRLVGAACAAQSEFASALESFGRALEIARACGHALNEAETLRDRALMRVTQGQPDLAVEDARAAIAIFDRLGASAEHEALERLIPWPA
ncbi:MAG TPA: tetratricopeptide repeat protein [Gemmatimonadaceae bacterium]